MPALKNINQVCFHFLGWLVQIPTLLYLGGKTDFSAKYQDFGHSTMFMDTNILYICLGSSGRTGALIEILCFTGELQYVIFYNIILGLGKTTNSQDQFPEIQGCPQNSVGTELFQNFSTSIFSKFLSEFTLNSAEFFGFLKRGVSRNFTTFHSNVQNFEFLCFSKV